MSRILVKKDPTIQLPSIEIYDASIAMDTPTSVTRDMDPTKIYGILSPLISIGDVVISPEDVLDFRLSFSGNLPKCTCTVVDNRRRLISLQKPKYETTMKIQILPPFPEVEKINMEMNITRVNIYENTINVSAIYKCEDLISQRVESFGKLDTYTLFEAIATALKLGFATNCEHIEDARDMYCSGTSYLELMSKEIGRAKNEVGKCIFDWWIDGRNYLNLANMYTLFDTPATTEDMQIYISTQPANVRAEFNPEGIMVAALLTNLPTQQNWETYAVHYETINKGGAIRSIGTDNVYSIYESSKEGYSDSLMLNADVKKNTVTNVYYLGESLGEYNSKLTSIVRENYLGKMGADSIKVILNYPALGIQRGQRVAFAWYINNPMQNDYEEAFEDAGGLNDDQISSEMDISNDDELYPATYGKYRLDKAVSGQYLITAQNIIYYKGEWYNELILCRPEIDNVTRLKN